MGLYWQRLNFGGVYHKRDVKPSATDEAVSNNFAATLSNRVPMKVVRNNSVHLKSTGTSAGRRALWRAAIKQILTAIKLRNMISGKAFSNRSTIQNQPRKKRSNKKCQKTIVLSGQFTY